MRISRELASDLKYLAVELEWADEDKAEIRAALVENPAFFEKFWTVYAAAHRAGYRFNEATGFQKLDDFCQQRGLPNPYSGQYVGAEVDAVGRGK